MAPPPVGMSLGTWNRESGSLYCFIANPAAGQGYIARVVRDATRRLAAAGHETRVLQTAGSGHATHLASSVPPQTRAVIAVGGDGTVREVSQGLVDRTIPLAVVPMGTENLLAKHFGYRASASQLCDTLAAGHTEKIDVGWAGQQIFLIVAGVGFDAEIVHRLSRTRQGNISRLSYVGPIWKTFWSYRFPRLRVEASGRLLFDGRGLVFVAKIPRYGPGLRICSRADCTDGYLDVCICPCASRLRLCLYALCIAARCHVRFSGALYEKVQALAVHSADDHVPLQLDGDQAGHLPQVFRVQPRALRLVVPTTGGTAPVNR